jgi:hypothetical protein
MPWPCNVTHPPCAWAPYLRLRPGSRNPPNSTCKAPPAGKVCPDTSPFHQRDYPRDPDADPYANVDSPSQGPPRQAQGDRQVSEYDDSVTSPLLAQHCVSCILQCQLHTRTASYNCHPAVLLEDQMGLTPTAAERPTSRIWRLCLKPIFKSRGTQEGASFENSFLVP